MTYILNFLSKIYCDFFRPSSLLITSGHLSKMDPLPVYKVSSYLLSVHLLITMCQTQRQVLQSMNTEGWRDGLVGPVPAMKHGDLSSELQHLYKS